MFRTRLISGIILVIIALAAILAGGGVLAAVLCFISLAAYRELAKACGIHTEEGKCSAPEWAGMIMTVIYYAALAAALYMGEENGDRLAPAYPTVLAAVALGLILFLFVYVFTFPKYKANQVMTVYFGMFYVAVMLSYVYRTRILEQGAFLVWLVILCSWGSDTCAYCVGMLIGKHKMAPVLSPKKSVEGGVGGVVGAALLGAVYAFAINKFAKGADADALRYAVICGAGSMISQVGDLAASAIKRDNDIKDYGHLIPGHGGILDRFDSVIFTAPIIYYLSVMLMK